MGSFVTFSVSHVHLSRCLFFLPNPNSRETNGAGSHRRKKTGIKSEIGKQEIAEKEKGKGEKKKKKRMLIESPLS